VLQGNVPQATPTSQTSPAHQKPFQASTYSLAKVCEASGTGSGLTVEPEGSAAEPYQGAWKTAISQGVLERSTSLRFSCKLSKNDSALAKAGIILSRTLLEEGTCQYRAPASELTSFQGASSPSTMNKRTGASGAPSNGLRVHVDMSSLSLLRQPP
jgi:hypothetical protein